MTEAELRKAVLDSLGDIAPEADLAALPPGKDLRDELDIDSMDFLNFVIALHEWLGVEIPEADYPQLVTLHQSGRPVLRSPLGTAGTIFLLESSGRRRRQ